MYELGGYTFLKAKFVGGSGNFDTSQCSESII